MSAVPLRARVPALGRDLAEAVPAAADARGGDAVAGRRRVRAAGGARRRALRAGTAARPVRDARRGDAGRVQVARARARRSVTAPPRRRSDPHASRLPHAASRSSGSQTQTGDVAGWDEFRAAVAAARLASRTRRSAARVAHDDLGRGAERWPPTYDSGSTAATSRSRCGRRCCAGRPATDGQLFGHARRRSAGRSRARRRRGGGRESRRLAHPVPPRAARQRGAGRLSLGSGTQADDARVGTVACGRRGMLSRRTRPARAGSVVRAAPAAPISSACRPRRGSCRASAVSRRACFPVPLRASRGSAA